MLCFTKSGLDDGVIRGAVNAIQNADLLIVAGTSLTVQPASSLITYFRGRNLVLVNRDATSYDGMASLVINASLGDVFAKFNF